MKSKRGKISIWILFSIYLLILLKVILFKYPIPIREILKGHQIPISYKIKSSNFIPLKSIFQFLFKGNNIKISLENVLGNIVVFVPFGFLLPTLLDRTNKFKIVVLSSFILSLMFEVIQLFTVLGDFDVDDILLNTIGGILGYLFYKLLTHFIIGKIRK